jgi:exonuclease VII large subunit
MALAADYMTSTPTAAAHLLSLSWQEAYAKVREFAGLVEWLPLAIQKTRSDLARKWDSLCNTFERQLESARQTVALGSQLIKHNDPARQLGLGYSIARRNGKVIRSTAGLSPGNAIAITVSDCEIDSTITNINHGKNNEDNKGTARVGKTAQPKSVSRGHQEDLGLV